MNDIKLTSDGDLELTEKGDIILTDSVQQDVRIKIQWLLGEWKFDPEEGFEYFDDLLIKNPDIDYVKQRIKGQLLEIEEIDDADVESITIDKTTRKALIKFNFKVEDETYQEEATLYG